MHNHLTLAVAGGRKTQGIVDYCAALPQNRRALVLTYTQTNQLELKQRISVQAGDHRGIAVLGWFSFLLRDFARPFIPFKFRDDRVRGFNFEGRPHPKAGGRTRFLDKQGAVYGCELSRLAYELMSASAGKLVHRLECMYDEILIDEVQDFSAYDWSILDELLGSSIDVRMVGDIRQAVLATNPRASKNKKYAYADAIHWFREREKLGRLVIEESCVTWRCHRDVARFSDTIFDPSWSFPATISKNETMTGHDGVFLLRQNHVTEYVAKYKPQCLRDSVKSGKSFQLDFLNFRVAKGLTRERVLIVPTVGMAKFIQEGQSLEPFAAAKFYVAATRAMQSVGIVLDSPGKSAIPYWSPQTTSGRDTA